jgi:hypothetical protein
VAPVWPWGKTRRVRDALAAYLAFAPPHPGKGAALTKPQRAENLAWFLAARAQRSAVLRETMVALGYPLPQTLPTPDAVETASLAFHRLSHDHLIGWKFAARGLDSRRALDPAAAGLDGFGRDIGMFLGDAAIALRPALAWVVGKARNMPTLGEIVIGLGPDAPGDLAPFEQDVLPSGPFQIQQVADNGAMFNRPNAFRFAVDLALGRYERPVNPP